MTIGAHESGHGVLQLWGGGKTPDFIRLEHIVESDGERFYQIESRPSPSIERVLDEMVGGIAGELLAAGGPVTSAGELQARFAMRGGLMSVLDRSPYAEYDAIFIRAMTPVMRAKALDWTCSILAERQDEFRALAQFLDGFLEKMPPRSRVTIPAYKLLSLGGKPGLH